MQTIVDMTGIDVKYIAINLRANLRLFYELYKYIFCFVLKERTLDPCA